MKRLTYLLLFVVSFSSLSLRAETTGSTGTTASATTGSANAFTPMQLPQVDLGQDRKKKQDGASMAAMMAAGMQSMTCMMMMNEARKMPPGSEKTMMMMMAMQQCAQAAQSAANAGQNKDGAQQLQNPQQQATPGQFNSQPQVAMQQTPQDEPAPTIPSFDSNSDVEAPEIAATPDITPAPVIAPDFGPPGDALKEASGNGTKVAASSIPESIDNAKISFDASGESSKAGEESNRNLGSGGSIISAGGLLASNSATPSDKEKAVADEKGGRKVGTGNEGEDGGGAGGGGGGSGDGDDKKSGNPLEAMMALLGGGGGAAAAGPSDGSDIVMIKNKDADKGGEEPGPRLFEYASYRYQKLAEDKRLERPKKKPADGSQAPTAEEPKALAAKEPEPLPNLAQANNAPITPPSPDKTKTAAAQPIALQAKF